MKKLLLLIAFVLATLFLPAVVANAEAVTPVKDAVKETTVEGDTLFIVQLDPNHVGKPGEIEQRIYDSFAEGIKKANHMPIPFNKAQKTFRIYLREEAAPDTQREQDLGVVLKSKDFMELAKQANVRYVLVVATRVSSAEEKMNFWTGSRKNLTILTNVVLYDAQEQDYLADQSFTDIGTTSGSYDRAYSRAINKLLKEIKVADLYSGTVY